MSILMPWLLGSILAGDQEVNRHSELNKYCIQSIYSPISTIRGPQKLDQVHPQVHLEQQREHIEDWMLQHLIHQHPLGCSVTEILDCVQTSFLVVESLHHCQANLELLFSSLPILLQQFSPPKLSALCRHHLVLFEYRIVMLCRMQWFRLDGLHSQRTRPHILPFLPQVLVLLLMMLVMLMVGFYKCTGEWWQSVEIRKGRRLKVPVEEEGEFLVMVSITHGKKGYAYCCHACWKWGCSWKYYWESFNRTQCES